MILRKYSEGRRGQIEGGLSGCGFLFIYGKLPRGKLPCRRAEREMMEYNPMKDEWIDEIGILAKLELTGKEREKAKQDIAQMIRYIERLKEVDTRDVEPSFGVLPVNNVFREDEIIPVEDREAILANAPKLRDGAVVVPRTIG